MPLLFNKYIFWLGVCVMYVMTWFVCTSYMRMEEEVWCKFSLLYYMWTRWSEVNKFFLVLLLLVVYRHINSYTLRCKSWKWDRQQVMISLYTKISLQLLFLPLNHFLRNYFFIVRHTFHVNATFFQTSLRHKCENIAL